MTVCFQDLRVGDNIPELVTPTIDRVQIVMFAGASGDFNPIHFDDERARGNGLPGIIAHGMLSIAILGRLLTNWVPITAVRSFSVRFNAMVFPGDMLTCGGVVKTKTEQSGEQLVELDLSVINQRREPTLIGNAWIALH
jgi:acyl dehydratase